MIRTVYLTESDDQSRFSDHSHYKIPYDYIKIYPQFFLFNLFKEENNKYTCNDMTYGGIDSD